MLLTPACSHSTIAPSTTTSTTTTTTTLPSSVSVTGETSLTGVGQRSQFTAAATLSDASVQDVTRLSSITWVSSNRAAAVISSSGVVTTIGLGTTTLIATYQGVTGSLNLTVTIVTTTFSGVLIRSDGQRGTFTLTLQGAVRTASAPTSAPVSGSFQLPGVGAVALSGFYDSYSGVVSFSGFSEGQFRFSGTIANGVLAGTYSGPNGSSGVFSSERVTVS